MSEVLVTGAAGFIGSQLAYRLWQEGMKVILVDDFSYGAEDNLIFSDKDFREEICRRDIRDSAFMEALFAEHHFDYVYHIAGITPLPDCQNDPVEATDVNVRGTVILLDLVRRFGIKKMVFASTSAVYENNKDFPSVEERVEKPSLIYPSTKYTAEQFCKSFADAYGIPIVCLRFANVFGPHIDCLRTQPPVMGYIIRELFLGNRPVLHATGNQQRDFIYVDDLIDLALKVREANTFDTVNVSTGKTVTINEIYNMIAEYMGTNLKPKYAEVGHFWANYPELYEEPYPIATEIMEHEVLKYTCLSNKHAYKKYGWQPKTTLMEGIRHTVDFSIRVLKKSIIKEDMHG
ncbi:NAD-dependent epimerase/dehydratase family protein [Selenomonas ruminantium]|uniref:UDP-glucose 4-epimerase n=1 Tax=Selenomonas ruminantium TaxID=971 RepID=A0A1H4AAG0_SELRU|nr:NAD-dependent epimerase/dehydratase family protein [Selenomonas ruminantium]SEA32562.1 UDP-glucose 4-epimerase [Selenomonas ruminantium]